MASIVIYSSGAVRATDGGAVVTAITWGHVDGQRVALEVAQRSMMACPCRAHAVEMGVESDRLDALIREMWRRPDERSCLESVLGVRS